MEAQGMIDPALVTGLFEQGLMGVDVPMELGGAGQTFLSSCLAVPPGCAAACAAPVSTPDCYREPAL